MRKKQPVFLAAMLAIFIADWPARASEITDRFDKMAAQLIDAYHAKNPGKTGETVAILPFNCSEALAKQHVGAAASELLTQRMVTLGVFRVVERDQLKRVLEEQSLGLTGAIDTASAASVGRGDGTYLHICVTIG